MTTYARIDPASGLVRDTIELTPEQFAALSGNPKQSFLRPLVIDAMPTPASNQLVTSMGYVVEATQVRQTWGLRTKTQSELDSEAQGAERGLLRAMITALQADVTTGITAAPTTAAQAFVEIQDLKRRALRADRILLWFVKQQT